MKKVFTLVFAFLAMTMISKAQILLSEGFEGGSIPATWTIIDSDGDGNNWQAVELDNAHSGSGLATSESYINYVGALTPDNWLISPAVTLTSPANLTFWVQGQDANYAAEYYSVYIATNNTVAAFTATTPVLSTVSTANWEQKTIDLSSYVGQTIYVAFRHHNITDMYRLNLDDIEIFAQPTSPTIAANPSTLNFPTTIVGNTSSAMQVNVMGYVLTAGINATTTAPFEISADGTTFGTTASLPANGGTMYVRYVPTTAGASTGSITLSSTGATDVVVALNGNAIECSAENTLPYVEDFDNGVFPPYCWQLISTASETWSTYDDYGNTWASCVGSDSEIQNEQLITNTFDFSNYTHAILMGFNFMSNYNYVVDSNAVDLVIYASTDGGTTFATTPIWKLSECGIHFANWTPTPASINISSLAGESNVAFKIAMEGSICQVLFDSLYIQAIDNPTITTTAEESYNMYAEVGATQTIQFDVVTYNLTTAAVATTDAPFELSADGTTFGTTATLPLDGGTIYLRYTAAAGTQTGNVTIAATGANTVTIALAGEGYTCGGFPIEENLNHGGNLPGCWTVIGTDENPIVMALTEGTEDNYVLRFSSYALAASYDQYLISPEITYGNGEMMFSFDYLPSHSTAETFSVGYSTTTNDISAFTWINDMSASNNSAWSTYNDAVPQNAKYVAIKYTSSWLYYLYIDNLKIEESNSVVDHTQSAVQVFPNPAADYVNITADASINSVEIFSLAGKKIAAYDANDMMTTINTSSLANGMYMIRINTENGVVTQKITVSR